MSYHTLSTHSLFKHDKIQKWQQNHLFEFTASPRDLEVIFLLIYSEKWYCVFIQISYNHFHRPWHDSGFQPREQRMKNRGFCPMAGSSHPMCSSLAGAGLMAVCLSCCPCSRVAVYMSCPLCSGVRGLALGGWLSVYLMFCSWLDLYCVWQFRRE